MDTLLIIFAKEPLPGQVKTRLCPPLTSEEAAELYQCFLADVLEEMQRLRGAALALAYTPIGARAFFQELAPPGVRLVPQSGPGLGERLTAACHWGRSQGFGAVMVRNSDSPDLPGELVMQARDLLQNGPAQVVLGPAPDGGYYLVGLTVPPGRLFQGISWSTATVLADTLAQVRRLGLSAELLPPWADIDSFADLQRFGERLLEPGRPGWRSHRKARELLGLTLT
jgi:rSAM/selenodomain-associated transferase 1